MAEAACEVWFYHLEQASLDQVLPELLEKTLARGWRARVRSPAPERLHHLDDWLWKYREDSFLPHGLADDPHGEKQPILLEREPGEDGEANRADALFLIDGAEPAHVEGFARCILIFDGRDEAALAQARQQWRTVKAAGHACTYWRQGERGWEKQG